MTTHIRLVAVAGIAVAIAIMGYVIALYGFKQLGMLLAVPAIIVNGVAVGLGVFRIFRSALYSSDKKSGSSSDE